MVPNLKRKGNSNMRKLKQYSITGAAALALALGGTGLALAASAPVASQPAGDVHACVKSDGSLDFLQFRTENYGKCAPGDAAWTWARTDGTAPAATTFGVGQVQVDGTPWAQYEAPELGAPGGDQASGTFRFTCKKAPGCDVSLSAWSTADGWTVYPRILLQTEDNTNGNKKTCEYADGSDNNGATTALTAKAATVPLGVGSTLDCDGTQAAPPATGGVTFINVPGDASGEGLHYDVFTTLTFVKAKSS
jgi:hypothetical protein